MKKLNFQGSGIQKISPQNLAGYAPVSILKSMTLSLAFVLCFFSGCKQNETSAPTELNTQSEKNNGTVSLVPDGVSIAAATAYTTATGTTTIGSIGVNENVDIITTSGTRTQVTYRTSGADKTGWVASTAVKLSTWRWPVEAVRTTQDFHAFSSTRNGYHLAIDMTGLVGDDNIRVPFAGIVRFKGYSSGNGNHVIIEHTNSVGVKIYSLYCHLLSASALVAGNAVVKGALIGVMGCTGSCTGKHLHYSLYNRNYSTDPYGYSSSGGTLVSHTSSKIVMSYTSGSVTYWDPEYVTRNSGATP